MFKGKCVQVNPLDEGLVEIRFDRVEGSVNKLDNGTVDEFRQAVAAVADRPDVRGVLVASEKDAFIVGADITEFGAKFRKGAGQIAEGVLESNQAFIAFEDLNVPTVVAINGFALGGGLELALAGALRVMASDAQVGLPEVSLGLFPGFGGTVRMCRVAGVEVAVDWVAGGAPARAPAALQAGVVDEVVEPAALRDAALALLRRCANGEVDWKARQQRKREVVAVPAAARALLFETLKARVHKSSPKHQPAAMMAVELMEEGCGLARVEALALEAQAFGRVAKTQAAASLVQRFLNDQVVKKLARQRARQGRPVRQVAVLGAGIMGGGIAHAAASSGAQVRLKDISQAQLDLGLGESRRVLDGQVKKGRLSADNAAAVLSSIRPQLDEAGFGEVDIVVEAIVENLEVKRKVLSALEPGLREDALIATNTSSLQLDAIGQPLGRRANFVGMHFFNPVPVMPLVEVVRGRETSEQAVATAMAWALAMRKTPILVSDVPGFLVNRILGPYTNAFVRLVGEGVDFEQIDRAMEDFGWPMGPAYLSDVVGLDTAAHVGDVIGAGYPDRMRPSERNASKLMVQQGRLGQKNGSGFYRYERDPESGRLRKHSDPSAHALLAPWRNSDAAPLSREAIVDRIMLPVLLEAVHALQDGTVGTAAELDMAMLLGVGWPAYLGGPLTMIDWLSPAEVVTRCDRLAAVGPEYAVPPALREMAASGRRFYEL